MITYIARPSAAPNKATTDVNALKRVILDVLMCTGRNERGGGEREAECRYRDEGEREG